MEIDTTIILSFLTGIGTALVAAYGFIRSRITPKEASDIYLKAKATIDEYNNATEDGTITTEEKLRIANKSLLTIQTILKSLEK